MAENEKNTPIQEPDNQENQINSLQPDPMDDASVDSTEQVSEESTEASSDASAE